MLFREKASPLTLFKKLKKEVQGKDGEMYKGLLYPGG